MTEPTQAERALAEFLRPFWSTGRAEIADFWPLIKPYILAIEAEATDAARAEMPSFRAAVDGMAQLADAEAERDALAAENAALREAFSDHDQMCASVRYPGSIVDPPDPCTCGKEQVDRILAALRDEPASDTGQRRARPAAGGG